MKKISLDVLHDRNTPHVARSLLGKYFVVCRRDRVKAYLITETEAYHGFFDRASHAYGGKRTARNSIMYGSSGYLYIYLVYGMHHMLNIVTGPQGFPAAVLIRGLEGFSGPGRLTRALGIDKAWHGRERGNGWYIAEGPSSVKFSIISSPRIGVAYAGKYWAEKPFRFCLKKLPEENDHDIKN